MLQSPAPSSRNEIEMNRYKNASSCLLNGSAPWTPINAVNIVKAMKDEEIRVRKPSARKIPPKNSESPAPQAKSSGAGKPIDAARSMSPSLGGNLPMPWANASEIPVKIRSNAIPAFAANDRPDSPPNKMILSTYFSNSGLFCIERMAQFTGKDNTCFLQ